MSSATPQAKPPLVVKVGWIDDEQRKAFHAREDVITDTVAEGLRSVARAVFGETTVSGIQLPPPSLLQELAPIIHKNHNS